MPLHFIESQSPQSQARRAAPEPSIGMVRVGSRARWLLTSCLLVGALVLLASLTGAQTGSIVVEDWSKQPSGKRGIPNGWQGQNWGSPKYDFTVTSDDSTPAIHLKSDNDSSTISREIKVDVKQYPILQWKWKVVVLPKAGDARKKETDDEAAQLYVTFPRFPSAVRSRIIGYIWDSNAPVGAVFPSQKVSTIRYLVVRSGDADLGKWVTETRNVLNDFKRIFGEDPDESVGAVAISINSQNTNARSESFFGEILFRQP
jgi:hypothetical protein